MTDNKICYHCKLPILDGTIISAKDKSFHLEHFNCAICNISLTGIPYIERLELHYCEYDYHKLYSPKCYNCMEILKGPYIHALNNTWHTECFVCTLCKASFIGSNTFRKHDGKPYCEKHYIELYADKCYKCKLPIQRSVFEALNNKYHPDCFMCEVDKVPIGEGNIFHIQDDKVYCSAHFGELFQRKCTKCTKLITDQYIKIRDSPYHISCWKCDNCEKVLQDGRYDISDDGVICFDCSARLAAFNLEVLSAELSGTSGIADQQDHHYHQNNDNLQKYDQNQVEVHHQEETHHQGQFNHQAQIQVNHQEFTQSVVSQSTFTQQVTDHQQQHDFNKQQYNDTQSSQTVQVEQIRARKASNPKVSNHVERVSVVVEQIDTSEITEPLQYNTESRVNLEAVSSIGQNNHSISIDQTRTQTNSRSETTVVYSETIVSEVVSDLPPTSTNTSNTTLSPFKPSFPAVKTANTSMNDDISPLPALRPVNNLGIPKSHVRRSSGTMEAFIVHRPVHSEQTIEHHIPYSQLTLTADKMNPLVDLEKRESYLSDEEFFKIFNMSKSAFYLLKKWKQDSLKKEKRLY